MQMYRAVIVAALAAFSLSAQEIRDSVDLVSWENESLKKWDLSMVRGIKPAMIMLMAIDTLDGGGEVGTVQIPFQEIRTVHFISDPNDTCTSVGVKRNDLGRPGALSPLGDVDGRIRWGLYDLGGRLVAEIDNPRALQRPDGAAHRGLPAGAYIAAASQHGTIISTTTLVIE